MPSYLEGSIGEITQAIISLWFRAPADALAALPPPSSASSLAGVLPLFTFGSTRKTYTVKEVSKGTGIQKQTTYVTRVGTCDWVQTNVINHTISLGSSNEKDKDGPDVGPSFLGITRSDSGYHLILFLLAENSGHGTGFGTEITFTEGDYGTGSPAGGDCNTESHWDFSDDAFVTRSVAPGGKQVESVIATDDSGFTLKSTGPDSFTALTGISVTPGKWHHLLLSFDVGHATRAEGDYAVSTSGDYGDSFSLTEHSFANPCTISAALDDVNHTGSDLRQSLEGLGDNAILSRNARLAYISGNSGVTQSAAWGVSGSWTDFFASSPQVTFSSPGTRIPATPFGIPVASNVSSQMHHVEMAEFQMWVGQQLDTGSAANRALFIARKKSKTGGTSLQPVKPKVAAERLGEPTILFHGVSKWKKGENKGTGGSFGAHGKIEKFKPDPEVGK